MANFIKNVKDKIYENTSFYKFIDYTNTKIIHGGLNSKNKIQDNFGKTKISLTTKSLPLEIKFKNNNQIKYNSPIYDSFEINNIQTRFKEGSLAMVKIGEKNFSRTEFFFSLKNTPELDGRYSVFGYVIKGYDVLENLNKFDLIKEIKISN